MVVCDSGCECLLLGVLDLCGSHELAEAPHGGRRPTDVLHLGFAAVRPGPGDAGAFERVLDLKVLQKRAGAGRARQLGLARP